MLHLSMAPTNDWCGIMEFFSFQVRKLGMPVRSLDIRNFHNYVELRSELAGMFNLEGLLDETVKSGWQLVFVDDKYDTLS